jgi:REP element-mobilizing transposase RayT
MKLYKNKFRIDSTRLKDWDYSSTGYYFVTICTKTKEKCFGDAVNGELNLTHLGKVACKYWQEIPHHFPHVKLDAFVVMPNHIHGIIIIENDDQVVETQNFASLQEFQPNEFGPQSKNMASIVRGYKIGVKKWATINNIAFAWQERFYDHIIRNEDDLSDIREYIVNNPLNWEKDEENKEK